MLDESLIRTLHVEALRGHDLHEGREPHVLFQASTIGALLDGAYEGDVTIGELGEHGDLGLGTLNGIDGEMIAVDGRFYRADVGGTINEIDPTERTPFAVVLPFTPTVSASAEQELPHDDLLAWLDGLAPAGGGALALRLDGEFSRVRARSVPKQHPPYRPLAEVIADQHVFELGALSGTIVGFRFPAYTEGIEVNGYHLHFISDDRSRGGHVLECTFAAGTAAIDLSSDLHVELPAGVSLDSPELSSAAHEAVERIEHSG
ncbi:MAG: acetolactate decarboxylase [Solirubrobacterales bacterium]|nr:acetolactate decarboxylase [Solirubrobacterales bacterium]